MGMVYTPLNAALRLETTRPEGCGYMPGWPHVPLGSNVYAPRALPRPVQSENRAALRRRRQMERRKK